MERTRQGEASDFGQGLTRVEGDREGRIGQEAWDCSVVLGVSNMLMSPVRGPLHLVRMRPAGDPLVSHQLGAFCGVYWPCHQH